MSFKRFKKILTLALLSVFTALTVTGIILLTNPCGKYTHLDGTVAASYENTDGKSAAVFANESVTYLSNMQIYNGGYNGTTIIKDKAKNGAKISLNTDIGKYVFDKGVYLEAPNRIIYNVSNVAYRYFTAFIGINTNAGTSGDGVTFEIATSADGGSWDIKLVETEAFFVNTNARFVTVDIQGAKFMRLVTNKVGTTVNDYSVFADAKFTDTPNGELKLEVESVAYYDELIKTKYANASIADPEFELALLQRNYVNKLGQQYLHNFIQTSDNNRAAFGWLFNNLSVLRMYTMGGEPMGSYANALNVLTRLYTNFKEDLDDDSLSALNNRRGDVYQKMMLALSLTHSAQVRFWLNDLEPTGVGNKSNMNVSDAVARYGVYKDLWLKGQLENRIFENIDVEEMRYVMDNMIGDKELVWLNDYCTKHGRSPYKYVKYTLNIDNYWTRYPEFYDKANIQKYYDKYELDGYGIECRSYYPHLWMVFETGGQCWQQSDTGKTICSTFGIPSSTGGQTKHLIYYQYNIDANGNGIWGIGNDCFGWADANFTGYKMAEVLYYQVRQPLGWGNGSYASGKQGSYIVLSQAALNDYENLKKAKEMLLLSQTYGNDEAKREELYRSALGYQKFNLDAWLSLINLYLGQNRTEREMLNLAKEVCDGLKYYPLPMYDMLRLISKKITSPEYVAEFTLLQTTTLQAAAKATEAQVLQSNVTRTMANSLLGKVNKEIAKFSFDGDRAGELYLGTMFDTTMTVPWEYSLDGGATWTQVLESSVKLTAAQIASVTLENKIQVHIVCAEKTAENIYVVPLTKSTVPAGLYRNDWENKIIGANSTMEWSTDGITWSAYDASTVNFAGDMQIMLRKTATKCVMASDSLTFAFTSEGEGDGKHVYLPVSHLSVSAVSSEATSNQGYAVNIIDGNYNTRWHSDWAGKDYERYIVIEFDKQYVVSKIEYIPLGGGNGKILQGRFLGSADGTEWTELGTAAWANNESLKSITFENTLKVKYIKIVGVKCSGDGRSFIGGRMLNFYYDESATNSLSPTAAIKFDITEITNKDVTVTLYNASAAITVLNNEGRLSRTFTENGTFAFEIRDGQGNQGTVSATVDWIDKTPPEATVSYNITSATKENVTATISFNEEVTVNNNGGKRTFTFSANGEFTFYFTDRAGNSNTFTARVDYIFKEKAKITTIEYSTVEPTKDNVQVWFYFDQEVTLNPNTPGPTMCPIKNTWTYTFTNNTGADGTLFSFMNKVGTYTATRVTIANIDRRIPVGKITYSTTKKADKVTAYITFDEPNVTITNNNGSNSYLFTKNNEQFVFNYEDRAGNKGVSTAKVTWIDPSVAAPEVRYDITEATNQKVTASLVVGGKVVDAHEFAENGVYTFNCTVDGTSYEASAVVSWIDKTPPVGKINYGTIAFTRQTVTVSITFDELGVTILNNGGSNEYTFTKNGEFTFEFRDEAGNIGTATANVYWIYNETPRPIVTLDITAPTNRNVTARIVDFENEGYTAQYKANIDVMNNLGSRTHVFTENGSFTFLLKDLAGNECEYTVTVDWIDKKVPVGTIHYDHPEVTNGKVTAWIEFDKENVTIKNNDGKDTVVFDENGSFEFEFADAVGNTGNAVATVNWIDKDLPNVFFDYNIEFITDMDVTVTISFDKEDGITIVNNDGSDRYVFTENGDFSFEYVYSGGKFATATANVSWIKKNVILTLLDGNRTVEQNTFKLDTRVTLPEFFNTDEDRRFIGWQIGHETVAAGTEINVGDDMDVNAVFEYKLAVTLKYSDTLSEVKKLFAGEELALPSVDSNGKAVIGWRYGNETYTSGDSLTVSEEMTLSAVYENGTGRPNTGLIVGIVVPLVIVIAAGAAFAVVFVIKKRRS